MKSSIRSIGTRWPGGQHQYSTPNIRPTLSSPLESWPSHCRTISAVVVGAQAFPEFNQGFQRAGLLCGCESAAVAPKEMQIDRAGGAGGAARRGSIRLRSMRSRYRISRHCIAELGGVHHELTYVFQKLGLLDHPVHGCLHSPIPGSRPRLVATRGCFHGDKDDLHAAEEPSAESNMGYRSIAIKTLQGATSISEAPTEPLHQRCAIDVARVCPTTMSSAASSLASSPISSTGSP